MMKKEKKCKRCGRKIDKNSIYCPYCGQRQDTGNGLLDNIEDIFYSKEFNFGFAGFFESFNKVFRNLIKQMEKEIERIDKEIKPMEPNKIGRSNGISIRIEFKGGQPKIMVGEKEDFSEAKKTISRLERGTISKTTLENIDKLKKLPRQEAKTKIKRFSNVIIYEIDLPGVKKIKDVEIRKLENSIEIKAISKDKIYFKLIPISLPILKYELKKEKLYIYFKPEV